MIAISNISASILRSIAYKPLGVAAVLDLRHELHSMDAFFRCSP
jgi:hypothetical protein